MKVIFTLIFSTCFCFPAFSSPPEDSGEFPGGTIANLAKALSKDLKKNIKIYVKKEYACRKYAVLSTEFVSMKEKTYIDGKGRLLAGTIAEKWTIEACGKNAQLAIVITGDGKKGNYIMISQLEADNEAR